MSSQLSEAPGLRFDPYDYAFQEDPYPVYRRLRDEDPLHHSAEHDLWVLSRHADVRQALRDDGAYSNAMGVSIDPASWGPHAHRTMSFLGLDGDAHLRLRSLVSRGFTPRRVRARPPGGGVTMGDFEDLPEARRRGLEKMEQVYGFEMTDGEGDFLRYTVEHIFGDVWQRPGLSDRDRRLLLVGLLAGSGQTDVLTIQLPAALRNGELDEDALREIVILMSHYAGWPVGSRLHTIVEETIAAAHRDD